MTRYEESEDFRKAKTAVELSSYYKDAADLAFLLTKWSASLKEKNRFVVCTGGGPGIMEAANKGAHFAGGKSVGLNIALPFEQKPNQFIDSNRLLTFDYFFVRKTMFMKYSMGFVAMPGGFLCKRDMAQNSYG